MDKRFVITEKANPNYLCTVCKIGEMFPIEGADRLVKTVINGYDIVIPKTHKEGDIVLYFPVETAICEQYLSANNLFEMSEFERNSNAEEVKEILIKMENLNEGDVEGHNALVAEAKSKCGFFNKHGRVRILKLRGQYSQGFVADVSTIVNMDSTLADVDWESMVGCQFNEVNGIEFCKKYVPYVKERREHTRGDQSLWKRRMRKLKKFNRLVEGQFEFHYDTRMLSEHIGQLSPNDEVSITLKVHGCVERDTVVKTMEYGDLTIGDIVDNKIQCHIQSFNIITNKIEYAPIEQFYYVPNDGEWYEIELEDGKKITITGNNPVWCPELNCYRRVDELNGDEKLLIF